MIMFLYYLTNEMAPIMSPTDYQPVYTVDVNQFIYLLFCQMYAMLLILYWLGRLLGEKYPQTFGRIYSNIVYYCQKPVLRLLLQSFSFLPVFYLISLLHEISFLTFSYSDNSETSYTTSSEESTTIVVGSSHTNTLAVGDDIHSINEPPLLSNYALAFPQYANTEIELYARIRILENLEIDQLPRQLNKGDYEGLVRTTLCQAPTLSTYDRLLYHEVFDITVLEKKAHIQDALFSLFLAEPTEQLAHIFLNSPFGDNKIREEALAFISLDLERIGLGDEYPRDNFSQVGMLTRLQFHVNSLQLQGRNSPFYQAFLQYYQTGNL